MARAKTPRKTNGNSLTQPEVKKTSAAVINPDSAAQQALLEEQIRFRAYQLFEQRGRTHGHAYDDWLRAEAEVRGPRSNRSV